MYGSVKVQGYCPGSVQEERKSRAQAALRCSRIALPGPGSNPAPGAVRLGIITGQLVIPALFCILGGFSPLQAGIPPGHHNPIIPKLPPVVNSYLTGVS